MAGLVQQDSQAVGKEGDEESSRDPRLCPAVAKSEMQVESFKDQVGKLSSQ